MENPIKMEDLGVPLLSETSTACKSPLNQWPRDIILLHLTVDIFFTNNSRSNSDLLGSLLHGRNRAVPLTVA